MINFVLTFLSEYQGLCDAFIFNIPDKSFGGSQWSQRSKVSLLFDHDGSKLRLKSHEDAYE